MVFGEKRAFAVLCAAMTIAAMRAPAATNDVSELEVARAALRDGLYEVARTHAKLDAGDAAARIVLESYAREGKWADVLNETASLTNRTDLAVPFFRAAALFATGATNEAAEVLASVPLSGGKYDPDIARLKADIRSGSGDLGAAIAFLDAVKGDPAADLARATLLEMRDETDRARAVWADVLAATNAPVCLRLGAAIGLGDIPAIRALIPEVHSADLRRRASLRLGILLLEKPESFAEGERTIRGVVRDAPDAPGARAAFLTLANALLEMGRPADAETAYRAALETWPDTARDARVFSGIGWACAAEGRPEDAQLSFRKAATLAEDDESRALALVKVGDELTELGRLAEASEVYEGVLRDYPTSVAGRKLGDAVVVRQLEKRGREAFATYRFADARKTFAEVAEKDRARAGLMGFFDALCLYGLGQDDEAEKRVRAILANPADDAIAARASLWLAKFLFNANRWKESETLFASVAGLRGVSAAAASEALLWAARAAFAGGDYPSAVKHVTDLVGANAAPSVAAEGMLVQGEALIELGRFDEAVLAFERVEATVGIPEDLRFKASLHKADAYFAMGADRPARYEEALQAYRDLQRGATLSPSVRLRLAFKTGRTLEKLHRMDEAADCLYTKVVLAYRDGRLHGVVFDDEARAAFARAAFLLADDAERRGYDSRAVNILRLVSTSDVPVAGEARRRIDRIKKKGTFL